MFIVSRCAPPYDTVWIQIVNLLDTGPRTKVYVRGDCRLIIKSMRLATKSQNQELFAAVYGSDPTATQKALARGANPNALTPGDTVLVVAARLKKPGILAQLLQSGADPLEHGVSPESAIQSATEAGRLDNVLVLLEAGANPNQRGWRSPLTSAIAQDNVTLAAVLLAYGATPNIQDGLKQPLREAKSTGMIYTLRQAGADPLQRGIDGKRPVDTADNPFSQLMACARGEQFPNEALTQPEPEVERRNRLLEIGKNVDAALKRITQAGIKIDCVSVESKMEKLFSQAAPTEPTGVRAAHISTARPSCPEID